MAKTGYDDVVAARTRAAIQILETADMLEAYLVAGGKPTDLTSIRDHGTRAEALNLAQTAAQASGGAATLAVLQELAWVQREYVTIMAALRSERVDLVEAGATPEVLEQVDPAASGNGDNEPLESPIDAEFRVGTMTLSWDQDAERVVIELFRFEEPEAEELMLVRLPTTQARGFIDRAQRVVSAGRPDCPFCGGPVDPDGHLCVRANGFRRRQ